MIFFLNSENNYFPSTVRHGIKKHFQRSLEVVFTIFGGCAYMVIAGAFLAFFIAVCEYQRAFYEYFCSLVSKCDQNYKLSKIQLRKTIRFHILVKM